MSFPGLQALQHSDVAALLPQNIKESIGKKTDQTRANLKKSNLQGNQGTHYWPIAVAIGVILSLAGIFLILAAHQVLPHGVNALSGMWGQVFGYGGLGVGLTLTLVSAVKWSLKKRNVGLTQTQDDQYDQLRVSATQYKAEIAEMDAYFPHRLQTNELLAVDNPSRKEVTIYYRQWSEEKQRVVAMQETFVYESNPDDVFIETRVPTQKEMFIYEQNREEAFAEWCETHSSIVKEKQFVTLDSLRQRTEGFERKKEQVSEPSIPVNIPLGIEETLNPLFESVGGLKELPCFSKLLTRAPTAEEMSAPIMKGWFHDERGKHPDKPFIALKLYCVTSKEEIIQKLSLKENLRDIDFSRSAVLVLCPSTPNLPLMWLQLSESSAVLHPHFFYKNAAFTYSNDGRLSTVQDENFYSLKQVIERGAGKDIRGICWEIVE